MMKGMKRQALFILGLLLALAAAYCMWDGDILGENTTGISAVMGIIGLLLIATSKYRLLR